MGQPVLLVAELEPPAGRLRHDQEYAELLGNSLSKILGRRSLEASFTQSLDFAQIMGIQSAGLEANLPHTKNTRIGLDGILSA